VSSWRDGEKAAAPWMQYSAKVVADSIDMAHENFIRDAEGRYSEYAKGYLNAMNRILAAKQREEAGE